MYAQTQLLLKYTNNYPILILNASISSFVNKVVHYFTKAFFSCYVQWSHLIERRHRNVVGILKEQYVLQNGIM